jgi:diaminopropionate ammonia-lyase
VERILFSMHDARAVDLGGDGADPRALHRSLPGYAPTPLREAPRLAERLGLARVWVKDESQRLGLPAFKILGASWATACLLAERLGLAPAAPLAVLRERAAALPGARLVAATDGNHGRGVARVARWLGLPARVFVPAGTARARIDAIAGEGAEVLEVAGSYDETVARAAAEQADGALLVQDHAWPGYEDVPRRVVEGYATIFAEADEQLAAAGAAPLRLALIQTGVGALAAAAVRHWRRPGRARAQRPALANVEPTGAACVLASVAAGRIVTVPAGAHSSLMAGLNCGTPSSVAWPLMREGMDVFVAVPDERAVAAMRMLADDGIVSGESGAAGVAGLLALCGDPAARARLGLDAGPRCWRSRPRARRTPRPGSAGSGDACRASPHFSPGRYCGAASGRADRRSLPAGSRRGDSHASASLGRDRLSSHPSATPRYAAW